MKGKAEDMMQSTKDTANATKNKTTDAAQSAKDMTADAAQSAKDKTADATQSTKDSAQQGKDQSAGFLQQVFYLYPFNYKIYDRLCMCICVYAMWFGVHSVNFVLLQTGEQVMNMAQGAVGNVKSTLGMGDKK